MLGPDAVDLVELDLLVSVAETKSMGRTAALHQVSQPAVSMRLRNLERRLGLQLVRRAPSGTRLTSDGEAIAASARSVLAATEDLAEVAKRLRARGSSHLRVAASFTVAEYLIPSWIAALHVDTPGAGLVLEVINSARVLSAVGAGRVDLGFVEGVDLDLAGLASETVVGDRLVVVVSPVHPWALGGRSVSGGELAAAELLVREPGSGTREVLEAALRPWGGLRSRLELGSSTAVLAAARRGEGPAILSALVVADDLASGRLVSVATSGIDLSRRLRAVWLSDVDLPPLARRLLAAARSGRVPD